MGRYPLEENELQPDFGLVRAQFPRWPSRFVTVRVAQLHQSGACSLAAHRATPYPMCQPGPCGIGSVCDRKTEAIGRYPFKSWWGQTEFFVN